MNQKNIRMWILLILSMVIVSCTHPTEDEGPQPFWHDIRDTVNPFISAVVNGKLYEVKNQTLAEPKPLKINGNIFYSMKLGSTVGSNHTITEGNTNIGLGFRRMSNLYDTGDSAGKIRSYDFEELEFIFIAPKNISAPFEPEKLRAISWTQARTVEYLTIKSPTSVANGVQDSVNTTVSYNLYLSPSPYNAIIERAWLILDEYNLATHRVSGRFSFRFSDPLSKVLVDIQNGKFTNLQLNIVKSP